MAAPYGTAGGGGVQSYSAYEATTSTRGGGALVPVVPTTSATTTVIPAPATTTTAATGAAPEEGMRFWGAGVGEQAPRPPQPSSTMRRPASPHTNSYHRSCILHHQALTLYRLRI